MLLPVFEHFVATEPEFFRHFTVIAPSYRGLFGSSSDRPVAVTFDNCVNDINAVLKHAGLKYVSCMVGWSTGAQVILKFVLDNPRAAEKLFLLNPSTGETLHSVLQPIFALPKRTVGHMVSSLVRNLVVFVRPICLTQTWNIIKTIALSDFAFYVLVLSAFLGGFPPEQPSFFMAYLEDTFATRYHTQHLLDLILALDTPLPGAALCHSHETVIISGLADIMTGVYHAETLANSLRNPSHHTFLMGSHFLLMEFPQDVGGLFLDLVASELQQSQVHFAAKQRSKNQLIQSIKMKKGAKK